MRLRSQDVDFVMLPGPDYPKDQQSATEEELIWPFFHVVVAADEDDLEAWVVKDFGTDRMQRPKGVVEIQL